MTRDLHTPDNESLMEFPCDFELKAMGKNSETFIDLVIEITQEFAPDIGKDKMRINDSKGGKFISVNLTFRAENLQQVHNIYGALKAHPEVLMTL